MRQTAKWIETRGLGTYIQNLKLCRIWYNVYPVINSRRYTCQILLWSGRGGNLFKLELEKLWLICWIKRRLDKRIWKMGAVSSFYFSRGKGSRNINFCFGISCNVYPVINSGRASLSNFIIVLGTRQQCLVPEIK